MTKVMKNYWVDIILLISGVVCLGTGYAIDFHLASTREVGMLVKKMHIWTGYIMTIAILLHVILHMSWLKNVTCKNFSSPEN
ncbi:MAG: hypothetical protein K0Q53_1 [Massilibacillus sp.]|jgi:hypothetical protein|nr:hypothetical protein [Massilibacillus sp.]